MAGNFTGLIYDDDAYKEKVARSTNTLNYRLDPNYAINCGKCIGDNSARGGHAASIVQRNNNYGNQINVDSILRGVYNRNTKSNLQQQPPKLDNYKINNLPDCPEGIESQNSRYSHPAFDIRGLTTSDLRLDYPLHDPQCQIFENFAINTRLQAKDNHKAIWQKPMDQYEHFPKPKTDKQAKCNVILDCKYAPYNNSNQSEHIGNSSERFV